MYMFFLTFILFPQVLNMSNTIVFSLPDKSQLLQGLFPVSANGNQGQRRPEAYCFCPVYWMTSVKLGVNYVSTTFVIWDFCDLQNNILWNYVWSFADLIIATILYAVVILTYCCFGSYQHTICTTIPSF